MSTGLTCIKRSYNISEKNVCARVIEAKEVSSGAIEVVVQTSCLAPDGKTHYQTNSMTLTDPQGGQQLEAFMYRCAEWLPKLLWENPKIILFAAQLMKSDGEYMNLTCTFNIEQPLTMISPEWVEIAALPQVGIFRPPENPTIAFPIHRAEFRFGKRTFETNVVAANANAMCVIGSTFILEAIGENRSLLFDLFLPDINRTLGNVARAKEKTVLVLGSYKDEGRTKLEKIRAALQRHGFEGVILDDFVDIHQQSLYEKMLMFGSLARFIICDESVPSGHLNELEACANIRFVTAILRDHGKPVTWMNADIAKGRDYMKIFPYESVDNMEGPIAEAISWAQVKVSERSDYYNKLYPWRNPNVRLG